MVKQDFKELSELSKLIKSIEKNNANQAKGIEKLVNMSKEQVKVLRNLADNNFGDFFSGKENKKAFKGEGAKGDNDKIIRQEERKQKLAEETVDIEVKGLEKQLEHHRKLGRVAEKRLKDEEKLAKLYRSGQRNAIPGIVKQQAKKIQNITGIQDSGAPSSQISSAQMATRVEQVESRAKDEAKRADTTNEKLNEIVENTKKEKGMLKGKGMFDKLKKMLGFLFKPLASLLGLLFSPIKAMGKGVGAIIGKGVGATGPIASQLLSVVGKASLLGGVAWMLSDFVEGFNKGGAKGGFGKMFLGDVDGTLQSTLKNAGKWAMLGAGIGSVVPVVGTIAGGIIGASVGLLLNYVANLVKGPGDMSSKISDFFFGGDGGVLSALFNGSKYAAMGALIGSVFPVVGTIAGGAIGFVVGFLINFVKQILPKDLKSGVAKIFSGIGRGLLDAWNWVSEKTTQLFNWGKSTMTSIFEGGKSLFTTVIEGYKTLIMFPIKIMDWIMEKLGLKEQWDFAKDWVVKKVTGVWDSITSFFGDIFDSVKEIFTNIKDSFKTVMGGYWKRIKGFFSFGEDKEIETSVKSQPKKMGSVKKGVSAIASTTMGVLKEGVRVGGKILDDAGNTLGNATKGLGTGGGMASGVGYSGPVSVQYNKEYHAELIKQKEHLATIADKSTLLQEVTQKIYIHLSNIDTFLKTDMFSKLGNMFENQFENMANTLRTINEDNRRWDYMNQTGSLDGYSNKYSGYAQELKNLSENSDKMKEIGNAINQVSNVNNQVTNIFSDSNIHTLRR